MANVPKELLTFVEDAHRQGIPRDDVRRVLQEAGWATARVEAALASYADVDFPLPVPKPRVRPSAQEAFVYLLLFTALSITAFNLGSLVFGLIDQALPDPADGSFDYTSGRIRWALSSLLVAGPLYGFLARLVHRRLVEDPSRRRSPVRKWLTYLALFVAASTLIGDLIALLNGLLDGDLSARFVLKSLTVAVIAGTVFGYYFWDLRQDGDEDG